MEWLLKNSIVPVYYHSDIDECKRIVDICYDSGIKCFEFVNRGDQALMNFGELMKYRNENYPDLKLGIGTIKSWEEAQEYISLEPDFLVSPFFDEELAIKCKEHSIVWVPGCATPTEIAKAEKMGYKFVKIFPASSLGFGFLKSIQPIFPEMKFMVTGGIPVDSHEIERWRNVGAFAVGLGSALFSGATAKEELVQKIKGL
ncbi:bifunctional 4-hydroxy-2-oxoglutarate aldolase/2-dehydro-3-deoxy-phosphogluconate aldolase [Elizabethkingia sp. JS20170427COW]|uniref:bifunctional 4-hydroxy-2-oxoglutarate aldolase/2-dehydro-3-deoxy-phosphogluconate aldolase n=1 Tax=Elizabethkingia sp. JS20170427COW TaxID=2583851 RepID=UPI0011109398|nr:bifunctional 4-hydroxy-2-oxoglutarate aldolase/2-dehydro-3-deoxy-phosphogluconate aldolase [Elizabethkingia sp. JS20170427COW]QCX52944.1 bifunctional 4-hydroxy-2-oxoglutarate aldolase/2-dehydro-3-deoxy-phosphogluconate aldolase [Elizabethkingia sp. JS20170427COW]